MRNSENQNYLFRKRKRSVGRRQNALMSLLKQNMCQHWLPHIFEVSSSLPPRPQEKAFAFENVSADCPNFIELEQILNVGRNPHSEKASQLYNLQVLQIL